MNNRLQTYRCCIFEDIDKRIVRVCNIDDFQDTSNPCRHPKELKNLKLLESFQVHTCEQCFKYNPRRRA